MSVKILGIVGTPIKNGNCQYIAEVPLKTAQALFALGEGEGNGF